MFKRDSQLVMSAVSVPARLQPCCLCSVVSRMETPDHWITYAHVVGGEVINSDARTAVHRRKVGNYY